MGSMSASDAAPLPRLGEVFFDVRGSSRSMRLSWYADTGISVFSVWQGGTCTGTFRLPREELPRLIEALHRGLHIADQRDPRGISYSRQISGAPTDPRLTMLPGYAGARDGDFTGPVTGDFRALRPDDTDRGLGPIMLGSASPRALPAPPAALPPGSYRDQPRYAEPAQYSEPAQYPQPTQYSEPAQYSQPAQYSEPAQYPESAQYAEQGYAERGYGTRNGYDDQGYGIPGEQGYGYGEPGAYPSRGYDDQSYQGQGQEAGFYAGRGYEQGDQRYDDHGYAQHGYQDYQDQGYPERGRHESASHPEQGYGRYGHAEPPKHAQGVETRGNYPGADGAAGSGSLAAYAEPGYQHGPAERGYSEPAGQAYADHGYDAYRYAERDYRGQEYPSPDESGQAYPERDYGGYAGGDQPGHGYQAGYSGRDAAAYSAAGYANGGHDAAGYGNAAYGAAGHDGAGYGNAAYGAAGHDGAGYGNAGYGAAGHDGAGYGTAGHGNPGYGGGGYSGASYGEGRSAAPGYDGGAYPSGGYDGAYHDGAPQAGAHYDGAHYGNAYDGAGYDSGGYDRRGFESAGYDDGSGRSGGYRQMPAGRGPRDRAQYDDPDITPSQPTSTFPYNGGPPPGREYRRRRVRYLPTPVRLCPRAAPTAFAEYRSAGAASCLSPRGDLRTGGRNKGRSPGRVICLCDRPLPYPARSVYPAWRLVPAGACPSPGLCTSVRSGRARRRGLQLLRAARSA
jgi:hypothetical protein